MRCNLMTSNQKLAYVCVVISNILIMSRKQYYADANDQC